jgi:hypothetical protein
MRGFGRFAAIYRPKHNGGLVKRTGTHRQLHRSSNPLSSTTHSPETDISACDAETQVISVA